MPAAALLALGTTGLAGAPGAPDVHTDTQLVALGEWGVATQVLVGVLALAVLGLTFYNYRHLAPRWRRGLMVGLRALVVALLVAVFYQPALLQEHVARGRNLVVVLVDTSESMGLPHGEATRVELARRFLARHGDLWERLAEQNDLVFHGFGAEVRDLADPREADGAAPDLRALDRQTRIVDALAEVRRRYRNQDLGAVLVLTDGVDTTPAGRRARLDAAGAALVRDLDAPVVSFTLPDDGNLKDVAVADVATNGFAFVLNATSLDATVRVHGYGEGTLTARLLENGREVARQVVVLSPGQADYPLRFEYVPRKLGEQVYAVAVDHLADEIYGANNLRQVVVDVIRDKIRVLQIVGQPSWDERFLRNHLKENPSVDLISFFILINPLNYRPVSVDETSLIPFPAQELFEEELGGFDLAIFQNFNYGPFRTRQYLPTLAAFVREGGAFLMVGGPKSFSAGGYYGTPITDILPVEIPPGFGEEQVVDERPFRGALTEAGRHHPITRLAQDPAVNAATWGAMEELAGVNLVTRTRDDAVVLLEHPTRRDTAGAPHPVVAVREVGEGRSMAVLTDSTWRWSFEAGNEGGDPSRYDSFWSAAIRWLIKDPEMDLVRVRVAAEQVPLGEDARATVEVFRPDYQPATDFPVEVTVRRRDEGAGPGEGEIVLKRDDARTDAAGVLELVVPFERAGIYEVEARARVVEGRVTSGSDLFVGTDLNPEMETIVGDGRLLAQLAEASGGSVQALTTDDPAVAARDPRVTRVVSRRHEELWNAPWVLLLIAGLLGAEWWLRRHWGYL